MTEDVVYSVFFIIPEISLCDISGISTKAPCEAALIGERHVRIEISDSILHTFIACEKALYARK